MVAPVPCNKVKSEAGPLVPTPNLLLVASQYRLALFWDNNPPVPIKGMEPAVNEENKGADEKVLLPAMVCAPVVITPLAVAEASGILNVWAEPEDEILKSVPVVPVANVWVLPVNPFKLVMAAPSLLLNADQSADDKKPL